VCGGHDDHDDLAPVHGQHHRGHDHENPMATQMLGHDTLDDLASMLVRDDYDDRDDLVRAW
jgi:hypothetical protein